MQRVFSQCPEKESRHKRNRDVHSRIAGIYCCSYGTVNQKNIHSAPKESYLPGVNMREELQKIRIKHPNSF